MREHIKRERWDTEPSNSREPNSLRNFALPQKSIIQFSYPGRKFVGYIIWKLSEEFLVEVSLKWRGDTFGRVWTFVFCYWHVVSWRGQVTELELVFRFPFFSSFFCSVALSFSIHRRSLQYFSSPYCLVGYLSSKSDHCLFDNPWKSKAPVHIYWHHLEHFTKSCHARWVNLTDGANSFMWYIAHTRERIGWTEWSCYKRMPFMWQWVLISINCADCVAPNQRLEFIHYSYNQRSSSREVTQAKSRIQNVSSWKTESSLMAMWAERWGPPFSGTEKQALTACQAQNPETERPGHRCTRQESNASQHLWVQILVLPPLMKCCSLLLGRNRTKYKVGLYTVAVHRFQYQVQCRLAWQFHLCHLTRTPDERNAFSH